MILIFDFSDLKYQDQKFYNPDTVIHHLDNLSGKYLKP